MRHDGHAPDPNDRRPPRTSELGPARRREPRHQRGARKEIEARGRKAVEFAKFSLKVFDDIVLKNSEYVKLITGDIYVHKTYNMGMVDAQNRTNFYDGKIRVTSPSGKEHAKYDCSQYREYVAERVEPWPT